MTNGEGYQRGMVIVAHADDAEFGCAGTVASWCRSGMEVVQVICTDGSKGSDDPNITSAELIEIRKREQQNAARVLGVKEVVFLGYEDSMLEPPWSFGEISPGSFGVIDRRLSSVPLRRGVSRRVRTSGTPTTWPPARPPLQPSFQRHVTGSPSRNCWRKGWSLIKWTKCSLPTGITPTLG